MGLGLMQQAGPTCYTLFGLAMSTVQIIPIAGWLHFNAYGPAEW